MTMLEKIVFVADYIEPNRKKLPDLDKIRILSFHDLSKAVKVIAKSTINYLGSQGMYIDRFTYELSDEV